MKPNLVHVLLRIVDYAMSPLMRLISVAPSEKPQESHAWHAQQLSEDDIASITLEKCVVIVGDDPSIIKNYSGGIFHMSLFGGWRNYVVLEVESGINVWHIGWIVRDIKTQRVIRAELHKLPLYDRCVRMLAGSPKRETTFCAFDQKGNQLRIRVIGKGKIGDKSEYRKIRLL